MNPTKPNDNGVVLIVPANEFKEVPSGNYLAELVSITPRDGEKTVQNPDGTTSTLGSKYLSWQWNLLGEEFAGCKVWANSSMSLAPTAHARQWVDARYG